MANKKENNYITCREFDRAISDVKDLIKEIKDNHLAHIAKDIEELKGDFKSFKKEEFKPLKKKISKIELRFAKWAGVIAFIIFIVSSVIPIIVSLFL